MAWILLREQSFPVQKHVRARRDVESGSQFGLAFVQEDEELGEGQERTFAAPADNLRIRTCRGQLGEVHVIFSEHLFSYHG